MAYVKQITIVGLGLIGGSLGLALRRRKLARRVVGLSRSMATVRRAKALGAIDAGTTEGRQAVADSELVVIATPVSRIVPIARRLARWMPQGAIVTDVGSTKSAMVRQLGRLPRGITFVGGHPLAGSEQRGLAAAHAGLFRDATVIVTPSARTNRRALQTVRQLWRRLGCRVVTMNPQQHDRVLAAFSHLPHALAFCLVQAADSAKMLTPPQSFLDMTRIAKSDPGLWEAIFLSNRAQLLKAMQAFDRQWRPLRRDLAASRRAALRRRLGVAKATRDALDRT